MCGVYGVCVYVWCVRMCGGTLHVYMTTPTDITHFSNAESPSPITLETLLYSPSSSSCLEETADETVKRTQGQGPLPLATLAYQAQLGTCSLVCSINHEHIGQPIHRTEMCKDIPCFAEQYYMPPEPYPLTLVFPQVMHTVRPFWSVLNPLRIAGRG